MSSEVVHDAPRLRRAAWEEKSSPLLALGKGATLAFAVLVVLFPMWSIVVTSFASKQTINRAGGMVVIPHELDISAYVIMLSGGQVTRALGVSLFVTLVGTSLSLFVTVLAAYGLSRPGSFGHRPLLF